eukprot:TRINITY_DN6152_c0_g1_i1.p1 TRINITY_DN6152_c0_g1~~TRINITY_DN6152_c0_g1_i1.p1  ORF type:complete len:734 (-),score=167.82 TRINITY_DN6152_c0_g1_i1:297-2498(-)
MDCGAGGAVGLEAFLVTELQKLRTLIRSDLQAEVQKLAWTSPRSQLSRTRPSSRSPNHRGGDLGAAACCCGGGGGGGIDGHLRSCAQLCEPAGGPPSLSTEVPDSLNMPGCPEALNMPGCPLNGSKDAHADMIFHSLSASSKDGLSGGWELTVEAVSLDAAQTEPPPPHAQSLPPPPEQPPAMRDSHWVIDDNCLDEEPRRASIFERLPSTWTGVSGVSQATRNQHAGRAALLRTHSSISASLRELPAFEDRKVTSRLMERAEVVGDMFISMCILANGICFGLQAEYMSENLSDELPGIWTALEIVFCIVFSTELLLRLWRHGLKFYTIRSWRWNVFDTFMVGCQFIDIFLETTQMGFVRLLRVFRLLRILRLIRLLHFFDDMNVVAAAIFASLKFLLGTCLLLFGLMYVFGIAFSQLVTAHRIENLGVSEDPALERWWGSLTRCMLSLYEAILGGVDWDEVLVPLLEMSSTVGALFIFYIAFAILAMMNVITGIFVDSAMRQAVRMKDQEFTEHLIKLYGSLMSESDGDRVSKEVFIASMSQPTVQEYISGLGVEFCDTATLFDLLDEEDTGYVSADALVKGMVRLRAGAKFLDIMALLSQIESGMVVIHEDVNRKPAEALHDVERPRLRKSLCRPATRKDEKALEDNEDEEDHSCASSTVSSEASEEPSPSDPRTQQLTPDLLRTFRKKKGTARRCSLAGLAIDLQANGGPIQTVPPRRSMIGAVKRASFE